MPVRIRLARHGRKARPFYHIVAADSRSPRDGKYIEKIGTFNPMTTPATVELNFDKALDWLQKGAQPSDTARSILKKEGVLYKKHLLGGVAKGVFDEAAAEQKFQVWLEAKRTNDQAVLDKLTAEKEAKSKEILEAETKIKEERTQAILKKNSELVEDNATDSDAETESAEEAPEEEKAE